MPILTMSLPKPNLFSNLPTTPPPTHNPTSTSLPQPPIPIPKYPPPSKPAKKPGSPLKTHHNNSKYHKPVKPGQVITTSGDRSVIVKDSGVSYRLPGAPFDFQFSYSETPKAKPVAIREPGFLPFAPPTMPRPWTGKAPMKKSKKNIKLFEPLNPKIESDDDDDGEVAKRYEMLKAYELGVFEGRPRKKVLGAPLTKMEIKELLKHCIASNRQVNIAKNGVYLTLVKDVRSAFEACPLVKIDCRGMHASDYKKLGAKLKELVPCVLLSFDDEQILMWRGKDWEPMYGSAPPVVSPRIRGVTDEMNTSGTAKDYSDTDSKTRSSSPKMMSLWKNAIDSGKALLLDDVDLKPDDLLNKVEEFESISQAIEHTYPALVLSGKRVSDQSVPMWKGSSDDDDDSDDDHEDKYYIGNSFEALESSVSQGLLPVDLTVKEFTDDDE